MPEALIGFDQPVEDLEFYTFWAWVPMSEITRYGPNAKGTTVANHKPKIDNYASAFAGYKLTSYERGAQTFPDGVVRKKVYFMPDRSSSNNTAVRTLYKFSKGEVHWPTVLNSIKLIGGSFSGPGSGDSGTSCELFSAQTGGGGTTGGFTVPADMPSVQATYSKDAYRDLTKFKVETFISDSPYNWVSVTLADCNPMYPRACHFDRHVVSLALPETLHAGFLVPTMTVELTASGVNKTFPSTSFAATNKTDWEEHVVAQDQQFISGAWVATVVTALVPSF